MPGYRDQRLQFCRLVRRVITSGMKPPLNWDDLRIIAAVRDEGTYAGASARLKIDETTVARRLARLQTTLGVPLFEAVDGARKATAQCEAIVAHVQEMARHVADIRSVGAHTLGPTGRVRIASTHAIAENILAPHTVAVLTQHPGLTIEFLTGTDNVNFSR